MFHYVWFKKQGRCINQKGRGTCIRRHIGDVMKVCPVLKDTINSTYELTKLVKLSPKRYAKLYSIQAENDSSGSNENGEFVDGLKNSTIKLFCHT